MAMKDKPIVWLSGEVHTPPFSKEARIEAGYLLRMLQKGEVLNMPFSRTMPAIGKGCCELRINDRQKTLRIIYRADYDAIIIGGVFEKKTRQTPQHIIEANKKRFREYDRITSGE
jgi:phage-related protein